MIQRIFLAVILLICSSQVWAEPPIPGHETLISTEEMYARWAKHTPEDILAHGKKAVKAIQANQKKAFAEFNQADNATWWPDKPFFSPIIVMNCAEGRDVTHPVDSFRAQLTSPGVIKKFQDARGVHTFFELCSQLKGHPQGYWMKQYHYWPGTKEPVWMAVMGMPVPGTPYHLQLFYITPNPNLELLNRGL